MNHLGRWIPLAAVVFLAVLGRMVTGTSSIPTVAAGAAGLLPPGAIVQEVRLEGGGVVRGTAIRLGGGQLEILTPGGWRSYTGQQPSGPIYSHRMYLGTDHQGRDVLARLVGATRTSLIVAMIAGLFALALGSMVGLGAATLPFQIPGLLRLLNDSALALPRLLILLILGATFRDSPFAIGFVIGASSWMGVARLVEAESVSLMNLDFYQGAQAIGAGPVGTAGRHLLPNLWPILRTAFPVIATEAILIESTLSFLGISSGVGAESWGNMIADGRRLMGSGWWLTVFPGIMLCFSAMAFHRLTFRRGSFSS